MKRVYLVVVVFLWACQPEETKIAHMPADGDFVGPDAGTLLDGEVTLDSEGVKDQGHPKTDGALPKVDSTTPPADSSTPLADQGQPTTDGPKPECMHDLDCDDQLPCTQNLCLSGKCNYETTTPGYCHIWDKCQKAGETQSPTSQLKCNPSDPFNWSVPDASWGLWAGDGREVYRDGTADQASFNSIYDMVVGIDGTLYVSTYRGSDGVIRAIKDGQVSLFAGGGTPGIEGHRLKVGLMGSPLCMRATDDGSLYFYMNGKWWRIYKDQLTLTNIKAACQSTMGEETKGSVSVLPNSTLVYRIAAPRPEDPWSGFGAWQAGKETTLLHQVSDDVNFRRFVKPPFNACGKDGIYLTSRTGVTALWPTGKTMCLSGTCIEDYNYIIKDGTGTTARFAEIDGIEHYSKGGAGGTMLISDNYGRALRLVGYCTGNVKTIWGFNSAYPATATTCDPLQGCTSYVKQMAPDSVSGNIYFANTHFQIFVVRPGKDLASIY